METFTITPLGPYRLEESALFGFGQRHDTVFNGTMRLAFCVDGYEGHAGVALTQQAAGGEVHGMICATAGIAPVAAIVAQVSRVLSLDQDARGYAALGDTDPVIARLQAARPGLRPPLFYSPYEAALWAVISMRRPRQTAERWRQRLAAAAHAPLAVAGQDLWAVPTPEQLIALGPAGVATAAGIEPARAQRVVAVAEAARAGALDVAPLAAGTADEARTLLRTVPGIGAFYADLILVRATGVTDVLPLNEPRLFGLVGALYGLGAEPTAEQVEEVAAAWCPWRTWVAVLTRAAGPMILGQAAEPEAAPV
jgi:DNA-3-methyladenine glycosylase II